MMNKKIIAVSSEPFSSHIDSQQAIQNTINFLKSVFNQFTQSREKYSGLINVMYQSVDEIKDILTRFDDFLDFARQHHMPELIIDTVGVLFEAKVDIPELVPLIIIVDEDNKINYPIENNNNNDVVNGGPIAIPQLNVILFPIVYLRKIANLEAQALDSIFDEILEAFPSDLLKNVESELVEEFREIYIKGLEQYLIDEMFQFREISTRRNSYNKSLSHSYNPEQRKLIQENYKIELESLLPPSICDCIRTPHQNGYEKALKQRTFDRLEEITDPLKTALLTNFEHKIDCVRQVCDLSNLVGILAHEFFHIIIEIMGSDDLLKIVKASFPETDLGEPYVILETLCDLFGQFLLNETDEYDPMARAHYFSIINRRYYEESTESTHPSREYRTYYQKAQRVHKKTPFNLAEMLNQLK